MRRLANMELFYFNQGPQYEAWECSYVKCLLGEFCHSSDLTRFESKLVKAQCGGLRVPNGLI